MPETLSLSSSQSKDQNHPQNLILSALSPATVPGTLCPDIRAQCSSLLDATLSAAQKDQIISALWTLATAFVDLAYGSGPVDQALAARRRDAGKVAPNSDRPACGQLPAKSSRKCDFADSAMVRSEHSKTNKTETAREDSGLAGEQGES